MTNEHTTQTAVARQRDEDCTRTALFGVRVDGEITDVCPIHLTAELRDRLDESPSIVGDAPEGATCGGVRPAPVELFRLNVERTSRHVGYDVYTARLVTSGEAVGEVDVVTEFEVTLAPETPVDLHTAAAIAAERLEGDDYRPWTQFASYGEHGSAVMAR